MFGVDWSNPETFWLNATNLMLGVVTLACAGALPLGVTDNLNFGNPLNPERFAALFVHFDQGALKQHSFAGYLKLLRHAREKPPDDRVDLAPDNGRGLKQPNGFGREPREALRYDPLNSSRQDSFRQPRITDPIERAGTLSECANHFHDEEGNSLRLALNEAQDVGVTSRGADHRLSQNRRRSWRESTKCKQLGLRDEITQTRRLVVTKAGQEQDGHRVRWLCQPGEQLQALAPCPVQILEHDENGPRLCAK